MISEELRHIRLRPPYEHVRGYFVARDGRIWSEKRKIFLKPAITPLGYKVVGLSVGGRKARVFFVHRLVAEAWIPPLAGKERINHKNGNKQDNRIENLERCTSSENNFHAYRIGLKQKGEKHPQAKLTDKQVHEIRICTDKKLILRKDTGSTSVTFIKYKSCV